MNIRMTYRNFARCSTTLFLYSLNNGYDWWLEEAFNFMAVSEVNKQKFTDKKCKVLTRSVVIVHLGYPPQGLDRELTQI